MIRLYSLVLVFLYSAVAYAQAPLQLNYQAVARNAAGSPLVNQAVKMRISIHHESPNGPVQYAETRSLVANGSGLIIMAIGSAGATNVVGSMATVAWATGMKFMQVEIDPVNGNSFVEMGTVQLLSVPFALHALTAAVADSISFPLNVTMNSALPLITLKNTADGNGVMGIATTGYGVTGSATSGWGGYFNATSGKALRTSGQLQIDNTGAARGKVLMTDENGNAHWEGGIAFSSYGLSTGVESFVVPTEGIVRVPFNNERYDLGNNFNKASSPVDPATFIAPVTGIYHFDAAVLWDNIGSDEASTLLALYVNGDDVFNSRQPSGPARVTNHLSIDLPLQVGDKVNLYVNHTSSFDESISGLSASNYFSGRFVSRL
jgi:hypothetical protein